MRKCVDCRNEEKITIKDGMYYYTCSTCAEEANKNHKEGDPKCIECGCYALEPIIVTISVSNFDKNMRLAEKNLDLYPIRPAEKFRCKGCGIRFTNPEYEKYLLSKVIKKGKF